MPRSRTVRTSTTPLTAKAKAKSTALDMGTGNQNEDPRAPLLGTRASRSLSRRQPSSHPASPTSTPQADDEPDMEFKDLSRKSQWIALAVMSGACAAFNGVFAKLYVILFLFDIKSCMAGYPWNLNGWECTVYVCGKRTVPPPVPEQRKIPQPGLPKSDSGKPAAVTHRLAANGQLADPTCHHRTTTELTTSFATAIANLFGLGNGEKAVEVIVRGVRSISTFHAIRF